MDIGQKTGSVYSGEAGTAPTLKFKMPSMIQKSDGGHGHDSADVAAFKCLMQEEVG